MADRDVDKNVAPHFDGEHETIANVPEGGPKMGIRIDADPFGKQNPNPFHLSGKGKKGIENFSKYFDGK